MKKGVKAAAGGAAVALLGAGCVALGLLYNAERAANRDLKAQLDELSQKEKRAAVLQSISAQMEDIAYQQKTISDEQREEALQQTRVANEMRHRSETERQNALAAEAEAVASQRRALEAQAVAEQQRQVAEQQRAQAEEAKSVADTLSYVALGRSLGSISTTQFQAGKTDMADLLAYASYLFTTRYGGDVYNPAVYHALTDASQSKRIQPMLNGAAMALTDVPGPNESVVSVSNYGELLNMQASSVTGAPRHLFNNKEYDFRAVRLAPNGDVCAVSRTGMLVVAQGTTVHVVPLTGVDHPFAIQPLSTDEMLVVGEAQVAVYNVLQRAVSAVKQLPFRVVAVGQHNGKPLLFDQHQQMHPVASLDKIGSERVPVAGVLSAYASSDDGSMQAYGMTDGTIVLCMQGGRQRQLVGHLSRISRLQFNGRNLYSSSYDGGLNLWVISEGKIEPITVFTMPSWMMDFDFDRSRQYVVAADHNGNIAQALIAVPLMVARIKTRLKRNLTPEEWNYYIGPNVPYERFVE